LIEKEGHRGRAPNTYTILGYHRHTKPGP
jgi:hypothetical protein